jgi:prepilin-type N-terminal cleavage/methylation domain-containing protein
MKKPVIIKNNKDMSHASCLPARALASAGRMSLRCASRRGFTLIEMLIVIAISAMLSAIAISYSGIGRNEVSLSVEAAKISQVILQAKSLSIATYGSAAGPCGYGVSFDTSAQTYSIFSYRPLGVVSCPSDSSITGIASGTMSKYSDGTSNIHVANGVVLSGGTSGDGLSVVLFYPPNPDTLISRDGSTFLVPAQTSKVYLTTVGGNATQVISVSSAGQVTF